MSSTVDQVATDALGLPVHSRALLVGKLLASLAGEEAEPAVEKNILEEVLRRREAVRLGKTELIDGDEALRRARAALRQ